MFLLGVGYLWSNVPSKEVGYPKGGVGYPGGGIGGSRVSGGRYTPRTTKAGDTHPTGMFTCIFTRKIFGWCLRVNFKTRISFLSFVYFLTFKSLRTHWELGVKAINNNYWERWPQNESFVFFIFWQYDTSRYFVPRSTFKSFNADPAYL